MPASNTQCNRCFRGRWVTRGIRESKTAHVRYLRCSFCGATDKDVCTHDKVNRRVKSASSMRTHEGS